MLEKMSKSVPMWFFLFSFWMLLPEPSVGLVKQDTGPVVISEQLRNKLEAVNQIRNQCRTNNLCNISKMTSHMDDRKKAGLLALLAGVAVSR